MDGAYTLELRQTKIKGVDILLMEHHELFPSLYPCLYDNYGRVRQLVAYSKAAIMAMSFLQLNNPMVITNDWTSGFLPSHCKFNDMLKFIPAASFFHIFHNLDKDYEGRVYLNPFESYYPELHHLPYNVVINGAWNDKILNPSRSVLHGADQWGTVSKSYKEEILYVSPLKELLRAYPNPFGYSNGIDKAGIKQAIGKKYGDYSYESHLQAKELI